ncbi:nucleotide exchange factor GrpE [Helcococcus kunzii]|uniref:nucleotide exchange factor GrpE n=1 Tax=Helcococcus kunzii TaxID=40091 RepID=UPI001BAFE997|nr:nucleotide exchange factor GrpE [Helcococcus kunzii]QUY65180.1 nucleotide exchange factor GrpE [Helcococcus kunzii]QZO75839.1 nucleotide exchange factor GrpE [Helcococcus kunzii]
MKKDKNKETIEKDLEKESEEEVAEETKNEESSKNSEEEIKEESSSNENEESVDENAKLKDSLLRLQADFSNYKRRVEKEKADIHKYAAESIITKLLPVLDNFDRAFKEVQEEDKDDAFTKGIELIRQDLDKILVQEGLEVIESDNQKFDANLHHAVFMEENDEVESEHIIETFQKGYKLKDKVIRPAMVKVSR